MRHQKLNGMEQIIRNVNNWISDDNEFLIKKISETVENNGKIHLTAPVGTGKTWVALNLIEIYTKQGYTCIILFPMIAISEQVQFDFNKRKVENPEKIEEYEEEYICAAIYNSKVKKSDILYNQVILSTIDSVYKLLDDDYFKDEKVIIFLDETHTYLQRARKNFSKSVEAIINSGFPIIGLSATPSAWVNQFLFGFEVNIIYNVANFKKKRIKPVKVANGLIRFVAEEYGKSKDEKWIIFLEKKDSQKKLKSDINKLRPECNVVILNAETKISSEKKTWDHLMKKGKLPKGVDVAIINSVAQAGINIKNKSIDNVILVGNQDPFGIAQFVGRTRNYEKEFTYYFSPGGLTINDEMNAIGIQSRIDTLNKILKYNNYGYPNLGDFVSMMGDQFSINEEGDVIANICMVATEIYSTLRKASGEQVCQIMSEIFSDDIIINDLEEVNGVTGTTTIQNKTIRDKFRTELVKELVANTELVSRLMYNIKETDTYEDALLLINESEKSKLMAVKNNKLFIKTKKEKKVLKNIVVLAEKSTRTLLRIKAAVELYQQSNMNKKVLNKYIKASNSSIVNLSAAQMFFEKVDKKYLAGIIETLEDWVDSIKDIKTWKEIIEDNVVITNISASFVDVVYDALFQIEIKEVSDEDGQRKKYRKLVGLNKSLKDYINYKGILKEFIPSTS